MTDVEFESLNQKVEKAKALKIRIVNLESWLKCVGQGVGFHLEPDRIGYSQKTTNYGESMQIGSGKCLMVSN